MGHPDSKPQREGLVRVADQPHMAVTDTLLEFPLPIGETVDYVTPADRLFVLAHLGVPSIPLSEWKLEIVGRVNNPVSLSYEQINQFPIRSVACVHQCAGNPFDPTQPSRTIANVEWGGVLLRDVLSRAGIQAGADYVWAFGLDCGTLQVGDFRSEPQQHYVKDIPLDYVLTAEVLLATRLNGQPLSEKHGFPVRLVVPGFYGTNSVKWLCRIELADRRADGLFTKDLYNDLDPITDKSSPVWKLGPDSLIVEPTDNSMITSKDVEIIGWAWSHTDIHVVEVSTDDGATWEKAKVKPRKDLSWQQFSCNWHPPGSGVFQLQSRAVDAEGNVQPMTQARNAVHRIAVTIC